MVNVDFTNDKNQIIKLWQKVFGDTAEDIEFFLEACKNKNCLGLFVNNTLVSMLFLVDCAFGKKRGKYIYAVCTDSNFRNRGYSSLLINKSKEF
ncbi:MAG: GNAT family N-acetyltransferase, partial [Clostridiales bacterium]|nr:GNAT family N-acetyltransferase [Clostridiales bacterium]